MHHTMHHTCTIHAPYMHRTTISNWKYILSTNFLLNSMYGACMVHVWCIVRCMYGAFRRFCMVQIVCCVMCSLSLLVLAWSHHDNNLHYISVQIKQLKLSRGGWGSWLKFIIHQPQRYHLLACIPVICNYFPLVRTCNSH